MELNSKSLPRCGVPRVLRKYLRKIAGVPHCRGIVDSNPHCAPAKSPSLYRGCLGDMGKYGKKQMGSATPCLL